MPEERKSAKSDEEDDYLDEEDKFEDSDFNADAMKGKPLKLDEDDLTGSMAQSHKSTKSIKSSKKSAAGGPSENLWTFNAPPPVEGMEKVADLDDGHTQLNAYKKLHENFTEQTKTVNFQKAKIAALQSELEDALKQVA